MEVFVFWFLHLNEVNFVQTDIKCFCVYTLCSLCIHVLTFARTYACSVLVPNRILI